MDGPMTATTPNPAVEANEIEQNKIRNVFLNVPIIVSHNLLNSHTVISSPTHANNQNGLQKGRNTKRVESKTTRVHPRESKEMYDTAGLVLIHQDCGSDSGQVELGSARGCPIKVQDTVLPGELFEVDGEENGGADGGKDLGRPGVHVPAIQLALRRKRCILARVRGLLLHVVRAIRSARLLQPRGLCLHGRRVAGHAKDVTDGRGGKRGRQMYAAQSSRGEEDVEGGRQSKETARVIALLWGGGMRPKPGTRSKVIWAKGAD